MGALTFGRYRSLFRIASGGMAEVFAARLEAEAGFEKLVAVKRILPVLSDDETFVNMLLEEARVGARLSSPHIVHTLDVGRDDAGAPYIVQELVLGVDLVELMAAVVQHRALVPIDVAVEILAQAAIGLHHAHDAKTPDGKALGLVHRDVSPHNLIVDETGRVRLTDFGIARVALDRLVATRIGQVKGKHAYLSPEQAAARPLDRRSDVFSLGIVACEVLAARRLFLRETPTATFEAVHSALVPQLDTVRADIPPGIVDAVAAALERKVDRRLESARRFADALRQAAREASLEPSDAALSAYVARVAPPRLTELRERLRQLTQTNRPETVADIDLPTLESFVDTEAAEPTTEPVARDDDATVLDGPGPTRDRPRPRIDDAATALLAERDDATIVDPRRAAPRGIALPVAMMVVGVVLALVALYVALLRG